MPTLKSVLQLLLFSQTQAANYKTV